MRALRALMVLGVILGTVGVAQPAQAAVRWNGLVVEVVNGLPSDWPVYASINWLDTYTASDMILVKRCSANAYRCITIKNARIAKPVVGWAEDTTITIDIWKTKNAKGYKGYFDWTTKRWLVAHELGHMFALGHRQTCGTVMDSRTRCPHVPPLALTTAHKTTLARW